MLCVCPPARSGFHMRRNPPRTPQPLPPSPSHLRTQGTTRQYLYHTRGGGEPAASIQVQMAGAARRPTMTALLAAAAASFILLAMRRTIPAGSSYYAPREGLGAPYAACPLMRRKEGRRSKEHLRCAEAAFWLSGMYQQQQQRPTAAGAASLAAPEIADPLPLSPLGDSTR